MKKIIYDFGSNNGDDIPYYLLKSDFVVAVEANPDLCDIINERFKTEISEGRLVVENYVITEESCGLVDFYIHKSNHVQSQLPPPSPENEHNFFKLSLRSQSVSEIIKKYGSPYYVKIDIEYCDAQCLRSLFGAMIFPQFISAESHSIEVFALLVAVGRYNYFKLVNGRTVSEVYSERLISCKNGEKILYSFPHHSAGPFGNDIDGEWMKSNDLFKILAVEGLGWKDIHATF